MELSPSLALVRDSRTTTRIDVRAFDGWEASSVSVHEASSGFDKPGQMSSGRKTRFLGLDLRSTGIGPGPVEGAFRAGRASSGLPVHRPK